MKRKKTRRYYYRGEWREGFVIGDYMTYENVESGQKEAQKEWGGMCKYIKVEKSKDGVGYRVYGVFKK